MLPNGGKVGGREGEVEEGGEIRHGLRTQMLQMNASETVWTDSRRVLGGPYGVNSGSVGKRSISPVEGTFVDETVHATGSGVLAVRDGRRILFVEPF